MSRRFVATTDQVNFGDRSTFEGASSACWGGWAYFFSFSNDVRVWSKWGTTTGNSSFIINQNTGGKVGLAIRSQETQALLYKETTSAHLRTLFWHHLLFIWEGGSTISIYVDGVSRATSYITTNSIGTILNSVAKETFGVDDAGGSNVALAAYEMWCGWRNVVLSPSEAGRLASGADPANIRSAAIVTLPTFDRQGVVYDRKSKVVIKPTGTRPFTDPPRIVRRRSIEFTGTSPPPPPPSNTNYLMPMLGVGDD